MWLGPRGTYCPAMVHKPVTKLVPFLWRNDLPKLTFHLPWLAYIFDEPNSVGQANAMSIRYNGRLSVHVSQDQIGTFPAYSRQCK